jgi:hypothetical protein
MILTACFSRAVGGRKIYFSGHIYKKIRFPQPLRFFLLTNAIWVTKNVAFDADLEYVEKLQKTHAKKVINEKVTEKSNSASNFAFYKTHMKLYKNLLHMILFFYHFQAKIGQNGSKNAKHIPFHIYSKSNSASNFAFVKYEIVKKFVAYISLFDNFQAKIGRNSSKNEKHFLFYIYFRSRRLLCVKKSRNRCSLMYVPYNLFAYRYIFQIAAPSPDITWKLKSFKCDQQKEAFQIIHPHKYKITYMYLQ